MADEEQFLNDSVTKLFGEIYNYKVATNDSGERDALKSSLLEKLKEYDNEFYKKYNRIPLQEIASQFASEQRFRDLPGPAIIQQNLMPNTFVSDAGYLTRYQRMHKLTTANNQNVANISGPPPAPERNFEAEFIDTNYVFQDPNLNQRTYLNSTPQVPVILEKRDEFLGEMDNNKASIDLITIMKSPPIVGEDMQPTIENHKRLIDKLGGFEDTLTPMSKQLNQLQIQSHKQRIYGTNGIERRQLNSQLLESSSKSKLQVNQKPSLVERSKQMREDMMKKMQQSSKV